MLWLNRLAYLIPISFGAAILALQPAAYFVPCIDDTPSYFLPDGYSRLLTDDSDGVAWMIRAENARRGRVGGRFNPDGTAHQPVPAKNHAEYERRLAERPAPTERYFLEYPPLALLFFRLCYLPSGRDVTAPVSAQLLDGHEFNLTVHFPADDSERSFYRGLRRGIDTAAIVLLLILIGAMALIQRGLGLNGALSGSPWLCVLPAILYFTPCRYDILPAVLVLLALAFTAHGRPMFGALAIGFAIAFKLYPLVIAPLILHYTFDRWKPAVAWCALCAMPATLASAWLLITDGWPAVLVPLQFQFGRPVEPMLVLYGRWLPMEMAETKWGSVVRNGAVLAAVAAMASRRPPSLESLIRRCALAIIAFVMLQVFYSPQWWLWFAFLLIPLARTHRGLFALIALADLLTYATFPLAFDQIIAGTFDDRELTRLADALTNARALLWLGIAARLGYAEWISKSGK